MQSSGRASLRKRPRQKRLPSSGVFPPDDLSTRYSSLEATKAYEAAASYAQEDSEKEEPEIDALDRLLLFASVVSGASLVFGSAVALSGGDVSVVAWAVVSWVFLVSWLIRLYR